MTSKWANRTLWYIREGIDNIYIGMERLFLMLGLKTPIHYISISMKIDGEKKTVSAGVYRFRYLQRASMGTDIGGVAVMANKTSLRAKSYTNIIAVSDTFLRNPGSVRDAVYIHELGHIISKSYMRDSIVNHEDVLSAEVFSDLLVLSSKRGYAYRKHMTRMFRHICAYKFKYPKSLWSIIGIRLLIIKACMRPKEEWTEDMTEMVSRYSHVFKALNLTPAKLLRCNNHI